MAENQGTPHKAAMDASASSISYPANLQQYRSPGVVVSPAAKISLKSKAAIKLDGAAISSPAGASSERTAEGSGFSSPLAGPQAVSGFSGPQLAYGAAVATGESLEQQQGLPNVPPPPPRSARQLARAPSSYATSPGIASPSSSSNNSNGSIGSPSLTAAAAKTSVSLVGLTPQQRLAVKMGKPLDYLSPGMPSAAALSASPAEKASPSKQAAIAPLSPSSPLIGAAAMAPTSSSAAAAASPTSAAAASASPGGMLRGSNGPAQSPKSGAPSVLTVAPVLAVSSLPASPSNNASAAAAANASVDPQPTQQLGSSSLRRASSGLSLEAGLPSSGRGASASSGSAGSAVGYSPALGPIGSSGGGSAGSSGGLTGIRERGATSDSYDTTGPVTTLFARTSFTEGSSSGGYAPRGSFTEGGRQSSSSSGKLMTAVPQLPIGSIGGAANVTSSGSASGGGRISPPLGSGPRSRSSTGTALVPGFWGRSTLTAGGSNNNNNTAAAGGGGAASGAAVPGRETPVGSTRSPSPPAAASSSSGGGGLSLSALGSMAAGAMGRLSRQNSFTIGHSGGTASGGGGRRSSPPNSGQNSNSGAIAAAAAASAAGSNNNSVGLPASASSPSLAGVAGFGPSPSPVTLISLAGDGPAVSSSGQQQQQQPAMPVPVPATAAVATGSGMLSAASFSSTSSSVQMMLTSPMNGGVTSPSVGSRRKQKWAQLEVADFPPVLQPAAAQLDVDSEGE